MFIFLAMYQNVNDLVTSFIFALNQTSPLLLNEDRKQSEMHSREPFPRLPPITHPNEFGVMLLICTATLQGKDVCCLFVSCSVIVFCVFERTETGTCVTPISSVTKPEKISVCNKNLLFFCVSMFLFVSMRNVSM